MTKQDTRKLSRSAAEAIRKQVVRAVIGQGMSQKGAAQIFGVTPESVCLWMKAYRTGGEKALCNKPLGRPKGQKLTEAQAAGIRKSIVGRCPDQLRLPGFLWTRDLVGAMIDRRHGITLSRWTVGRYLKSWGLTVQKPMRRAMERNPAQVRYWLQTKYPAIKEQAKAEGASIWWGDETGLRSDHQTGTTWGERGKTPVVKKTGRRFGCNMLSAITNQGDLRFMVFEKRFTSPVFLDFLERLVKSESGRKVYLIVDRHSVHKSKAVSKWVAENADKLSLFLLPPYSPELNPDELLNQDLKNNARRRQRARAGSEMVKAVRSFLRSRQRTPAIIKRYFTPKPVAYAA
jgi:transposase